MTLKRVWFRKSILAARIATLTLLLPVDTLPQTPTAPPVFEAATVKINTSGDRTYGVQYLPGGRFSARNMPMGFLILEAYNVLPQQLTVDPGTDQKPFSARYDIEAVADKGVIPSDASLNVRKEKLRPMVQNLLIERFRLVVNHDFKDRPVYAIVIGKNGSKLQKAAAGEQDCAETATCQVSPVQGIHGKAFDLSRMARALSGFSDRPILDKTSLTGLYNIQTPGWADLRMLSQPGRPAETDAQKAEAAAVADPSRPTLFMVLDELGLKLEPQTVPVEILSIVHIEPLPPGH
jgi:uncharacterized protein (TIGR03435 family)